MGRLWNQREAMHAKRYFPNLNFDLTASILRMHDTYFGPLLPKSINLNPNMDK